MHSRVTDDPTPSDARPARLELRLDEQHQRGVRTTATHQRGCDGEQRDEGEVGDHDLDGASDDVRLEGADVRALEDSHACVATQQPCQLPASHIDRDHLARTSLEQAVGEPTGRRAGVEGAEAPHVERECVEGGIELLAATRHEAGRRTGEANGFLGTHKPGRDPGWAPPHGDATGRNRFGRLPAAADQPAPDQLGVEPTAHGSGFAPERHDDDVALRVHGPTRLCGVVLPLHDQNPTPTFPFVVLLLVVINVVVFVFVQPHDGGNREARFTYRRAAIPCEVHHHGPLTIDQINTGECARSTGVEVFPHKNVWLAVVVSMFLHASLLHILGNMLFLWIFGNNVEEYLTKLGFALFYLAAGAFAFATYLLSDPSSVTPIIGASGAIAGVMGMYLVLWPRARVITVIAPFIFLAIPLPAAFVLLGWLGMQFFTSPSSSVAWVAHVGGFGFGMVMGLMLRSVHRPRPVPPAVRR